MIGSVSNLTQKAGLMENLRSQKELENGYLLSNVNRATLTKNQIGRRKRTIGHGRPVDDC